MNIILQVFIFLIFSLYDEGKGTRREGGKVFLLVETVAKGQK